MDRSRAEQLIEAGQTLRLAGDLAGARRLFEKALKSDPENELARRLLVQLGEGDGAGRAPGPEPLAGAPTSAHAVGETGSAWGSEGAVEIEARPGAADPLAMMDSAAPPRAPAPGGDQKSTLMRGAKDLLDLADHSGALDLLDKVLAVDPQDAEAAELRSKCHEVLLSMFESKIGDFSKRPRVALQPDEIIWLNLDHRAGFVLAQIDGTVSFEDLFSLSGMSQLDTARIISQLLQEKVITA